MNEVHVCEDTGCSETYTQQYQYDSSDDKTKTWLCREHAVENGFCRLCMHFCAGIESYDFSPIKGYCGECVDELRYETGEYEDDDDGWGWDEYGAAWIDDSTSLVELEQDIADAAGESTTPTEHYIGPDNPAFGGQ